MLKCKLCERVLPNSGSLIVHLKACEKIFPLRDEIRRSYTYDLCSIRDLAKTYNLGIGVVARILGPLARDYSESGKIAKKKYPLKHSEETKDKIRKKRLDFMKRNPEKTSWRQKNISYPESIFITKMNNIGWDKKYSIVREFSVFPFFIDFAFMNERVAVEIDGSQHLLEDRKKKDEMKDNLLTSKGWTIIRITEHEIKKNIDAVIRDLEIILSSSSKNKRYDFGILKSPKTRVKKERLENGLTASEFEKMVEKRKVERPSYDELKKLVDTYGYVATGRKYGVSDNSIRKWLRFYLRYEQ